MTFEEGIELYRRALARYFHPTEGFGTSQKHYQGDGGEVYARHARLKAAAVTAPAEAEAAMCAAGLDVAKIKEEGKRRGLWSTGPAEG